MSAPTTPRNRFWSDTRGAAIYVELLIVVPLIALLWASTMYVHRLGASQVQVQRQARQCAWAFATDGCDGNPPAGCELEGPSRLDSPELDRIAGAGLATVVQPFAGLAALFQRQTGDEVVARGNQTVTRPNIIGGSADTTAMHRMMCNERPPFHQLPEVAGQTCRELLGPGAQCP